MKSPNGIIDEQTWREYVKLNRGNPYNLAVTCTAYSLMNYINQHGLPTKTGYWPDKETPHGYLILNQPQKYSLSGQQAEYVLQVLADVYILGQVFYDMYRA